MSATQITISSVIDEVQQMMNSDVCDQAMQTKILKIFNTVLNSETYIETIKNSCANIQKDSDNISKYVVDILLSAITLNTQLPTIVSLPNSVSSTMMKYIIYGSLYFFIVQFNPDFLHEISILSLRSLFSSSWTLVSIDPATIKAMKNKCFGMCCGSDSVQTKQTPDTSDMKPVTPTNTNEPTA